MDNEAKEVWEELLALTRTFYAMVTEINTTNPYAKPLRDLETRIAARLGLPASVPTSDPTGVASDTE